MLFSGRFCLDLALLILILISDVFLHFVLFLFGSLCVDWRVVSRFPGVVLELLLAGADLIFFAPSCAALMKKNCLWTREGPPG